MKIASLIESPKQMTAPDSCLGERRTPDIEFDFPMMGVFVTSKRPSRELLAWLRNSTMEPYAIRFFPDEHAVIAMSTKHDAYSIYAAFQVELQVSVVESSRSTAEVARDIEHHIEHRNTRS